MKNNRRTKVTLAIGPDVLARIDKLAKIRSQTRAETVCDLVHTGLPLAEKGLTVNLARVIGLIEALWAYRATRLEQEDPAEFERLKQLAPKQLIKYHT